MTSQNCGGENAAMATNLQEIAGRPALGVWLRAEREGRGWSRRKLSVHLDVDPSTIKRWETPGGPRPDAESLTRLIELFYGPLPFTVEDAQHFSCGVNSGPDLRIVSGGGNPEGYMVGRTPARFTQPSPGARGRSLDGNRPSSPNTRRPHASG